MRQLRFEHGFALFGCVGQPALCTSGGVGPEQATDPDIVICWRQVP